VTRIAVVHLTEPLLPGLLASGLDGVRMQGLALASSFASAGIVLHTV
jgi:hypothetical protein